MFTLIYEANTTNDGYDLVKPDRYINYMATIKELFAVLNKKELNDSNISWECVQVKVFALIDEWNNKYYENCNTNVISNSALNHTRKKCVVFECENNTYQMILDAISGGQNVIRLSDYKIDSASVKYLSKVE